MKVLVTGTAGFIGFHTTLQLLGRGHHVIGIDNINDYYDPELKFNRLNELGIDPEEAAIFTNRCESSSFSGRLKFIRLDIQNNAEVIRIFEDEKPEVVCHLAAQAGVRYSLENPGAYIQSNIVGFHNIMECSKIFGVKHFVYASSSSVYGKNEEIPFSTDHNVDHPISLYAATKKSNELMAHTYSHLFGLPTTGLRFFTVYGPWGRPDMALFIFTKSIINGDTIDVYNYGKMERDFTYIDDIVEGVVRIIEEDTAVRKAQDENYKLYNIGNSKSVKLMDFISAIEAKLGMEAEKNMMPIQPGDVERTWADVDQLAKDYNYRPQTPIEEGVGHFIDWYKQYYQIN